MSLEVQISRRLKGFTLEAAFQAPDGGITALFGPSGAGKTSIVHAVAGLMKPDQGRIAIGGRVVLDTAQGICLAPERRRAGLVFQDARLFPHMNVQNNLLFGWRRAPIRADDAEIRRLISLLGLEKLLPRSSRNLSGGEKSRVALGRALLSAPEILLLDEPLAALDEERRGEILPYLERLRDIAKIPMLYVSHARDEVSRLADRVVMLEEGRVTGEGKVGEMLAGLGAVSPLGAVLDAEASGRSQEGLEELRFDGGSFWVPQGPAPRSGQLRLRIAAEEILLARQEPHGLSANNILPVTVTGLRFRDAHAHVELACGPTRLVAHITAASARRLALAPGLALFAIVKSVTVETPRPAP